jgi:hypothetical protein
MNNVYKDQYQIQDKKNVICEFCKKEIAFSEEYKDLATLGKAFFTSLEYKILRSSFPDQNEHFPFHNKCFFLWVYEKLNDK